MLVWSSAALPLMEVIVGQYRGSGKGSRLEDRSTEAVSQKV